jgi:hypothetical protein
MTDKFAEGDQPMTALAFARREIDDWLKVKLSRGRCSDVMRSQLAAHYVNRTVDVHSVLREIWQMDGTDPRRTSTPKGRALTHSLSGLMHKHYFHAPDILLNLINHWSKPSNQVQLRQISDEFDRDGHVGKYLHALVLGGHVARHASRQVAGEWIVYARFARANYYLTLATHDEAKENQDAIWSRAQSCVTEFPELRGHVAFNRTGSTETSRKFP